jgi:hypothetical protein
MFYTHIKYNIEIIKLPIVGTLSVHGFLPMVWQSCYKRSRTIKKHHVFDIWTQPIDKTSCEIILVNYEDEEKTIVSDLPMCLKKIVDLLNDFNIQCWLSNIEYDENDPDMQYIPDATYHCIEYDRITKKCRFISDS